MDNTKLFQKARLSYLNLEDNKIELKDLCDELAARLGIKAGEVKKLIEADVIANACSKTTLQLKLFDTPPMKAVK